MPCKSHENEVDSQMATGQTRFEAYNFVVDFVPGTKKSKLPCQLRFGENHFQVPNAGKALCIARIKSR